MFDWERFKTPQAADRIHPFWFWNGEMDDDHIRHQIAEMADKGLGGFFLCARQGMKLAYLSDTWFRKVRVAVEAAKEHGLHVWLYDEYPYPSGIAGGEVTLEHPEAKHYSLTHRSQRLSGGEAVSLELPWARILYAQAAPVAADGRRLWEQAVSIRSAIGNYQADPIFQKTGLTAYNQKRFFTYRTVQRLDWTAPEGEWEVLVVQEKEIEDFKYYGTFVDPCNREAMATFIRLTHDKYAARLGDHFGTTIKGMFTDEIGLLGSIPWSPQLADYFRERHGYELRDRLHALLDPQADDAARIRYDYYQAVHELLRDSYHKQVHDWCERHGLEYVAEVPSVRHTTQLYSHVPGGDTAHEKLGRSLDWILNNQQSNFRSNAKMVSSLARQLGRERNLIECFHSVGWSMTLQDARWMIDRLAAQGTNFFNFHAFYYTVDGMVQHDAPPSQFLQNPYWSHFRKLGDYTGRISYVMTSGEAVISAAVLEPTTSLWTHMGNPFHGFPHGATDEEEKRRLELLRSWWQHICNRLTASGRDYDHLDPELLAGAIVEDGRIRLGRASYSLLVMPPLTNLEGAAWERIREFVRQGGTVVSLGQLPYERIELEGLDPLSVAETFGLEEAGTAAIPAAFWEAAAERQLRWSKGEREAYYLPFAATAQPEPALAPLTELLDRLQPLPVRVAPACGELGLLLQTRRIADDRALVFVSNQEGAARDVTLRVEPQLWGEGHSGVPECSELSLDSGEIAPLAGGAPDGAAYALPLRLAPYEARLVELRRGAPAPAAAPAAAAPRRPWRWELPTAGPWQLQPLRPNALRFDTFRLNVSGAAEAQADTAAAAAPDAARLRLDASATVGCKTFIDQCADLAADTSLPVRMSQMFGTPMKVQLAYPLTALYTVLFDAEQLPAHAELLMDRSAISGEYVLRLNGHTLEQAAFRDTFFYDHNNVSQDVTAYLQAGENVLSVEVRIEHDWDGVVDALYLTGPFEAGFGPDGRAALTAPATAASAWAGLARSQPVQAQSATAASAQAAAPVQSAQPLQAGPYPGYPYYAGEFSFTRTFRLDAVPAEPTFELTFPAQDPHFHDCAEVRVNGRSLGVRAWTPYRWQGDSSLLNEGDNVVEVIVTNTLIGLLEGKYFDYGAHAVRPVQEKEAAGHGRN